MALAFTQGKSFASGDTVTNANFMLIVSNMAVSVGANRILGAESGENEAGEVRCEVYGRVVMAEPNQAGMRTNIGIAHDPVATTTTINLALGSTRIVDLQALSNASPLNVEAFSFTNTNAVAGEMVALVVKLWPYNLAVNATYTVATGSEFGTLTYNNKGTSGAASIRAHLFVSDGLGGLWPTTATLFQTT